MASVGRARGFGLDPPIGSGRARGSLQRQYNSQSKKLNLKTINDYFIGYYVRPRGSKFYCLSHTTRVIKSDRVIFSEDDISISQGLREIFFKEQFLFLCLLLRLDL